ncbi:MAG: hypothetical protein WC162_00290 [Sphaerochaetaceae bacterium]
MANTILLLNILVKSLIKIEEKDAEILKWTKNKVPFCHRLACNIEKLYPEGKCMLCPIVENKAYCDILLTDGNSNKVLAIFYKKQYFNKKEQSKLIDMTKKNKKQLIIGLTVNPKKSYFLIYRTTSEKMEYYHFLRDEKILVKLKNKNLVTKDLTPSLSFSKKHE